MTVLIACPRCDRKECGYTQDGNRDFFRCQMCGYDAVDDHGDLRVFNRGELSLRRAVEIAIRVRDETDDEDEREAIAALCNLAKVGQHE